MILRQAEGEVQRRGRLLQYSTASSPIFLCAQRTRVDEEPSKAFVQRVRCNFRCPRPSNSLPFGRAGARSSRQAFWYAWLHPIISAGEQLIIDCGGRASPAVWFEGHIPAVRPRLRCDELDLARLRTSVPYRCRAFQIGIRELRDHLVENILFRGPRDAEAPPVQRLLGIRVDAD